MAYIIGTDGNNTLTGTAGADEIRGGAGDDQINGASGDDTLSGEDGNDVILGGSGNDELLGGEGDDRLDGGVGNDVMRGGAGSDYFRDTSGGNDQYFGDGGNDYIEIVQTTTRQRAWVDAGDGEDIVRVYSFNGVGADLSIRGGDGDDLIEIYVGARLELGLGSDTVVLRSAYTHAVAGSGVVISDFTSGNAGDVVDFTQFLISKSDWDGISNPFALGYVVLVEEGPGVRINFDFTGGADSLVSSALLSETSIFELSSKNFSGFSPHTYSTVSFSSLGTAALDTFISSSGSHVVLGGAGIDTMQYTGGPENYAIGRSGSGWVVERDGAPEGPGTDQLSSVEVVSMSGTDIRIEQAYLADEYQINVNVTPGYLPTALFGTSNGGFATGVNGSLVFFDSAGIQTGISIAQQAFDGQVSALDGGEQYVFALVEGTSANLRVVAKIYGSNGALQATIPVSNVTTNNQYSLAVVELKDGSFLVSWTDGWPATIYAKHFSATGAALSERPIIIAEIGYASTTAVSIEGLDNGGFVVSWTAESNLYASVFDSAFNVVADSFILGTSEDHSEGRASIAAINDGFVVTWPSESPNAITGQDGWAGAVRAQIFDNSGSTVGQELSVNIHSGGWEQTPHVTALDEGGFVITWASYLSGEVHIGSNYILYGQQFSSAGERVGDEFRIGSTDAQTDVLSAEMSDGRLLIASGTGVQAFFLNSAVGTAAADVINLGGPDGTRMFAEGGSDTLNGSIGADYIDAGAGNDRVQGRSGDDTLIGGAGEDTAIFMGARRDYHVRVEHSDLFISDRIIARDGADHVIEFEVFNFSDGSYSREDLIGSTLTGTATSDFLDASAAVIGQDLSGRDGSDTLLGGRADDYLGGGAGNDRLTGGAGNDILDGGAGIDTAVYSGLFRSYEVHHSGGEGTVSGGSDGTDTLTGIEVLQFLDGKFVFDADGVAAQVTRLYDTVLQRAPDQVGLDLWVDALEDRGGTLKDVANGFLNSAEFQAKTGSLSDGEYVEFLFQNALGRASDADGKAFWVGKLSNGSDRADLLIGFSESAEHRALTADLVNQGFFNTDDAYQAVALLYDSFAGREPDAAGLTYWGEALRSGSVTLDQVAAGFVNSVEFQNRIAGMSHADLVEFMYQNTLDRGADAGGRDYWVSRLDNGLSDTDLLLGFSQSTEHFYLLGPQITNGIDYFT